MSQLTALRTAKSLTDVARLLNFKPSALSYVLYKMPNAEKYRSFDIAKRYGGTRTICAPEKRLKLLQRRLSDMLQNCLEEINANEKRRDQISHGFKRNKSIVTNAQRHRNRRYVFNVDLHDFFGTINFGRVRGYFIKDRHFSLEPKVATVLAQISCYDGALPQGSPCSPVISNLIGHVLDLRLVKLAHKQGCIYSRYADDLTFSTNKPEFPSAIAVEGSSHTWIPGPKLLGIVHKSGFSMNPRKTRMQYKDSRQDVTGLIVNRKVNVRTEYRHAVRAMVHRLLMTGEYEIIFKWVEGGIAKENRTVGNLNQLHGMLAFINSIDRYNLALGVDQLPSQGSWSKESAFRRFLLFKDFYITDRPVIICEGPTDNVYLMHAIRSLSSKFTRLASVRPDGSIAVHVRLYKYSGRRTGRILQLNDGGTGLLAYFIRTYWAEARRFKAPGKFHPVVVVIDNDAGAAPVFDIVQKITGKRPNGSEPHVHVFGNLYVVPVCHASKTGGKKGLAIEDLFKKSVLATKVSGKTFHSDGKGFDTEKHYGKKVLAHTVVASNAGSIDFGGFTKLLANIEATIDEHAKIYSTAGPGGS